MDDIVLNFLNNNNTIREEDSKNINDDILSNKSFEDDTLPDEDFNITSDKIKRQKLNSYPNVDQKGPNINLKIEHKRYSNQKEKEFFFEKIKRFCTIQCRICGGRYKTRTCDLPHVKRMRYQLRQSSVPASLFII